MEANQVYALLKVKQKGTQDQLDALEETVANIDEETIGAAAEEYLGQHPEALLDLLGFYIDEDGDVCQREEE